MSIVLCDYCRNVFDSDDYPEGLYAEEEGIKFGFWPSKGKVPDFTCRLCRENHHKERTIKYLIVALIVLCGTIFMCGYYDGIIQQKIKYEVLYGK